MNDIKESDELKKILATIKKVSIKTLILLCYCNQLCELTCYNGKSNYLIDK